MTFFLNHCLTLSECDTLPEEIFTSEFSKSSRIFASLMLPQYFKARISDRKSGPKEQRPANHIFPNARTAFFAGKLNGGRKVVDREFLLLTDPRYRVRNTCGSNEPRPHLIPTTGKGRQLVEIDAPSFIGRTGLCPGVVTLEDGSKTLACGFINITDDAAADLMEQLDGQIDQLERAATC